MKVNILLFFIQSSASAAGMLILRSTLKHFDSKNKFYEIFFIPSAFLGYFLVAVSFALWLIILSKTETSIAYPITVGLTLFFTVAGSKIFLSESISLIQLFGLALLLLSFVLISSD